MIRDAAIRTIRYAARTAGQTLPLEKRQAIVEWMERRRLPGAFQVSMGLLDDMRREDPARFHRFLWSKHLAYAETYEIPLRFGAANINPTRLLLIEDMRAHLRERGIEIESVCDIGCSLGYLLRFLEIDAMPSARIFHGVDVDAYAVATGQEYLRRQGSKIELFAGDMVDANHALPNAAYDIALCCGVLMYADQAAAQTVVTRMLSITRHLAGIICLAPDDEGVNLGGRSQTRESDGACIHDVAAMIHAAGGCVVSRKWTSAGFSGGNASYLILAEPPGAAASQRR